MSARDARSLFAAARQDGPGDVERDVMFREIAVATGLAAATAATASAVASAGSAASAAGTVVSAAAEVAPSAGATTSVAAKAGGAFGVKLLAVGAALGAAGTVLGALLTLTVVAPERSGAPGRVASIADPATVSAGARLAQPSARKRDPADGARDEAPNVVVAPVAPTAPSTANGSANAASDLGEEARLVTAARNALVAGDAARALALVQGTRKLSARSLEPEELGLEARALRALGRADDAAATELVLRRRYPDHALAR